MKTFEILEKARKIVEEHWTTGSLYFAGSYCALGAIGSAAGLTNEQLAGPDDFDSWTVLEHMPAVDILSTCVPAISELDDDPWRRVETIWRFNDQLGKAHEEILQAFDCAIDKARAVED